MSGRFPLSPILLFAYDRPDHLEATLETLKANPESQESKLHVFCDGPRNLEDQELLGRIAKVRQVVRSKPWCGEVQIHEFDYNRGLADSIISGVSQVLKSADRVIVLEDDLELSPGFLKFMNQALEVYKDENEVMHVSGYIFPVKQNLPETFFFDSGSCWGWGTWRRSWEKFNPDAGIIKSELIRRGLMSRFNLEDKYPFSDQLDFNISGARKTWAIKWYGSIILSGGHCLHPGKSFVNNRGHDGSGNNCGETTVFSHKDLIKDIQVEKIPIKENSRARRYVADYLKYIITPRPTWIQKIKANLPFYP